MVDVKITPAVLYLTKRHRAECWVLLPTLLQFPRRSLTQNQHRIQNVLEQPGWISLSLEDIGRLQTEAILVVSDSEIFEGSLANVGTLGIRVIIIL